MQKLFYTAVVILASVQIIPKAEAYIVKTVTIQKGYSVPAAYSAPSAAYSAPSAAYSAPSAAVSSLPSPNDAINALTASKNAFVQSVSKAVTEKINSLTSLVGSLVQAKINAKTDLLRTVATAKTNILASKPTVYTKTITFVKRPVYYTTTIDPVTTTGTGTYGGAATTTSSHSSGYRYPYGVYT